MQQEQNRTGFSHATLQKLTLLAAEPFLIITTVGRGLRLGSSLPQAPVIQ